ncbi:MAG: HAD family hydrolase [Planctomycetia bacterium]|nr:HAD family hydrolase [Planctomycetia bacterium]
MERTRYILLDRDGTIIVDRHFLADADGVELLPNAAEGLRRMARLGFRFIIVTNQSGLGRGYFDETALAAMHARLRELLTAENIALEAIYHCPHTDEHGCECRKPRTGMADLAAREHAIDLRAAFVIGDKCADVELGQAVGATTVLVRTGHGLATERAGKCRADFTADDLCDAADWIESRLRSQT